MAKLTNVKTVDMVNGEITKVTYNGAEYALVSGEGKVEDLALCNREHPFFTRGGFYEVITLSGHGENVHAIDDEYDRYYMDVQKTAKLFRKISVSSPTIEERVTALEADVATIKGESKPATYEPKVGDIVKITANTNGSRNKVGDIGKITEVDAFSDGICARVHVHGTNNLANWTRATDIQLATAEEIAKYEADIAEANKPKLKAGDFVTLNKTDYYDDITEGIAYEVLEDDGEMYFLDDEGDRRTRHLDDGEYEIVPQEEVAKYRESAKWAKIGRKVNEFRKGDIVRSLGTCNGHRKGVIGTVVLADGSARPKVLANGNTFWTYVELVAPVESLV